MDDQISLVFHIHIGRAWVVKTNNSNHPLVPWTNCVPNIARPATSPLRKKCRAYSHICLVYIFFFEETQYSTRYTWIWPNETQRIQHTRESRGGAPVVINSRFHNGETTCCHLPKRLRDNSIIAAAEAITINITLDYFRHTEPVRHDVRV